MNARWLVLLLAAAVVSAQKVKKIEIPSGYGSAMSATASDELEVIGSPVLAAPQEPVHDSGLVDSGALVGGRKMLVQRSLLGTDGDGNNVTVNPANNVYSKVGRHCPTVTTAALYSNFNAYSNYTEWAMYGEMVHDNFICNLDGDGKGKVVTSSNTTGVFYGGAAQDFGTARPLWESYGWSLFKLQDPPAAANLDDVKIQGVTLHVIGNTGTKHTSGVQCGIKGVSIAIYNSEQSGDYSPTKLNYTKYIDLTNAAAETFKWSTNRTAALYVDIGTAPDAYPRFDNSTFHWLRVKLHADYTGWSGATGGQCFVFWGVSSAYGTGNPGTIKSRWQERVGGSSGYSTTCTGAATSGLGGVIGTAVTLGNTGDAPDKDQTWWNCWNNGLHTAAGNTGRRCSTYRMTVNPAIPSADCLDTTNRARFHDYNYAFTGIQGQSGVGEEPGQGGLGGAR